jgi:DNA-binding NarL/FixJ family response regulator
MVAKVLIVEDDLLVALGMADVVTLAGHQVVGSARTVSEALEKARTVRPDVAVFDIRLAGRRDGVEGASALKQMCGTEVVFVSSESDRATLERARALGPAAFLTKPCHPRDLLAAVQKAAGPQHAGSRFCFGWV